MALYQRRTTRARRSSEPSNKVFGEPERYESLADTRVDDALSAEPSDLPDGWNEVKDAAGTYYWHVSSGTTQWNKPQKLESASSNGTPHHDGGKPKPKAKVELKKRRSSAPSSKMFGEPEMYESLADTRNNVALSPESSDLPDGWKEVKDVAGTFYWHVASGTTQWNKPQKLESVSSFGMPHHDEDKPKPKAKVELRKRRSSEPSSKMFGEPDIRDDDALSPEPSDLPDGWKEVKDTAGTYYWHISSGTTQWNKPQKLESASSNGTPHHDGDKPKPKVEPKKVRSFSVHSMGWLELEESQLAPHNISDTIEECISNLASQRKDLRKKNETWGNGNDLHLLLVSDTLKLVDAQTRATLLVQQIRNVRGWNPGRNEQTDFAYVARDQTTGKHKCHVFRCHGTISGRTINNKLHEMCNKIAAEKEKARENQQQATTGLTK